MAKVRNKTETTKEKGKKKAILKRGETPILPFFSVLDNFLFAKLQKVSKKVQLF